MTLLERFYDKVKVTNSCWLWIAAKDPNGYGRFGIHGQKTILAHRLSYEINRGLIPKTLTLDHLCRNPSCVNPWHLEPVTQKENVLRGVGVFAINAKKTHCLNGHELSGSNLVWRSKPRVGRRECRKCSSRGFRRNPRQS